MNALPKYSTKVAYTLDGKVVFVTSKPLESPKVKIKRYKINYCTSKELEQKVNRAKLVNKFNRKKHFIETYDSKIDELYEFEKCVGKFLTKLEELKEPTLNKYYKVKYV